MREADEVSGIVVDAAYRLHTRIGPGLLEKVYERLLEKMLVERGLKVESQKEVSFELDGILFEKGFRVDLLVEDCVVVEVKALEKVAPTHARQLLSYLRLMQLRVGVLLNFGVPRMNDGVKRVVNGYAPHPSRSSSVTSP